MSDPEAPREVNELNHAIEVLNCYRHDEDSKEIDVVLTEIERLRSMESEALTVLRELRDELQLRINATRIVNTVGLGWKDGMSEAVRCIERVLVERANPNP